MSEHAKDFSDAFSLAVGARTFEFRPVGLRFAESLKADVFAAKNNKTLRQTIVHPKYLHLADFVTASHVGDLDDRLGEFLINLKKAGNAECLKFLNKYGVDVYCDFCAATIRSAGYGQSPDLAVPADKHARLQLLLPVALTHPAATQRGPLPHDVCHHHRAVVLENLALRRRPLNPGELGKLGIDVPGSWRITSSLRTSCGLTGTVDDSIEFRPGVCAERR